MAKRTRGALGLAVVSLAMGCSAIAGLGTDYTAAAGSDAGAAEDGHLEDASESTDAPVAAMHEEAGFSSDAAAEASACATDCATPLPTGAGWSLVAYNPSSTGACPAGYSGAEETLLTVSADPYTCTCGCTVTAPPTCKGVFNLANAQTCPTATSTDPSYTIPSTANPGPFAGVTSPCVQESLSFQPFGTQVYAFSITPVTDSPGSCMGTSTATNPSTPAPAMGEACGVPPSNACACPPAAPSGWGRCAMSTAPAAVCPSGLTTHTMNAGGSVHDTRACGGCAACTLPDPQCSEDLGSLTFYTDSACNQNPLEFGSSCNGPSSQTSTASYTVSFSMNPASCTAGTGPTSSGEVTLTGGTTVTLCCE